MFEKTIKKYFTVIKFLISGGIATAIDLAALFYFTDMVKMWYLVSAILAFLIAFIVSFTLQKFWTFSGTHAHRKREQIPMYFAINIINLGVNSLGMYLLVEKFVLWYMAAQVIMSAMIAFASFFVYRFVIFKSSEEMTSIDTQ